MKFNLSRFGRSLTVRNCLIAVCLLLIAMSAVVQVLHFHNPDAVNEARHCPICHVAGAVMLALVIALLWFGLSRTAYVALPQTPHLYTAFESFSLFSRPPPLV